MADETEEKLNYMSDRIADQLMRRGMLPATAGGTETRGVTDQLHAAGGDRLGCQLPTFNMAAMIRQT